MKNKFFLLSIVVVVIFAGAFWYLSRSYKNSEATVATAPTQSAPETSSFQVTPVGSNVLIKAHSPVKGNINAKVTVVEFLDPECEACGATYPLVKKIIEEFAQDVKLVVRYMPYHQNSKFVANILEGARAQGKYWEALELLFATQKRWADHHNPNPGLIPEILAPLKLDMNKILADAKSGKYDSQIDEDQNDGNAVGVNGTPSFFVNGHQLQELGYEPLRNAILENLKK